MFIHLTVFTDTHLLVIFKLHADVINHSNLVTKDYTRSQYTLMQKDVLPSEALVSLSLKRVELLCNKTCTFVCGGGWSRVFLLVYVW